MSHCTALTLPGKSQILPDLITCQVISAMLLHCGKIWWNLGGEKSYKYLDGRLPVVTKRAGYFLDNI